MCNTSVAYKETRFSQTGNAMHTCNGDIISGLPFGKKAPQGECMRCDELRNGAATRTPNFVKRKAEELQQIREIKKHNCKTSNCGTVCTFGQW